MISENNRLIIFCAYSRKTALVRVNVLEIWMIEHILPAIMTDPFIANDRQYSSENTTVKLPNRSV